MSNDSLFMGTTKRHKNGMFFLGGDTNGFNENRKIHSRT